MRVQDVNIRSWSAANAFLGKKNRRKLCNNTVIRRGTEFRTPGIIVVELHGKPIVLYFRDGSIVVDSCGYRNVAARQRMNRLIPERYLVFQHEGVWWLDEAGLPDVRFRDCMELTGPPGDEGVSDAMDRGLEERHG